MFPIRNSLKYDFIGRLQIKGWKKTYQPNIHSSKESKVLERKWQPTPVFLSGESHGQRSLAGYSPWDAKESDTAEATEHAQRDGYYLLFL